MNAPHWHLLLNHFPVLGTLFGLGLWAFALWRQSPELKRTALGVFVLMALLAVPAYLTGEPSEKVIQALPGVTQAAIETHEDAANIAFIGILVLGVGALAGLVVFWQAKLMPRWFSSIMLAAALAVSGLMAWTANLGGQVRHTELRGGASAPAADRD